MDQVLRFHLPLRVWRGGEVEQVGAYDEMSVRTLEGIEKPKWSLRILNGWMSLLEFGILNSANGFRSWERAF
jgi:hypothetical protein